MELLKEMTVFAQVVDSAGFSAAARHLKVTTAAVSRHVSRLEAHMGGRLLQRTTRSMALTELGEQVYAGCVRLVSTAREVHALAGDYSAKPSGRLLLSAPVVFGQVWLAPRLVGFLDRYPEVDLSLGLVDRSVDLIEEGIDLAIRISRELAPGLAARALGEMRYVMVASPVYLSAHGRPAVPQDLPKRRCIFLGYGAFGNEWTLQRNGARVSVKVPARAAINNSAAILAMVEADGGIGLVPDFTAQAALATGRVERVLPDWQLDEPYTGTIYAVYTPGRHLALKTRALIDYLAEPQT
ncbi:LysR family transcriptional regulator [soil metagenome]